MWTIPQDLFTDLGWQFAGIVLLIIVVTALVIWLWKRSSP